MATPLLLHQENLLFLEPARLFHRITHFARSVLPFVTHDSLTLVTNSGSGSPPETTSLSSVGLHDLLARTADGENDLCVLARRRIPSG